MNKIKIITDSTSDLPLDIVKKYDIEVLPLIVNIDGESYKDGVDISTKEYLRKMEASEQFPVTTQINPQRFYDCYKYYFEKGYKIVSIHLSSKMSGTYQSSKIAAELLQGDGIIDNIEDNIKNIDALNVTSGLGILVIKAAELRDQGKSISEIKTEIEAMIPHVKSCLAFGSLDNLVKGGRLSKTAGFIGNMMGIKLILEVNKGEMAVMDKVRGSKKAIKKMLGYIDEKGIKENTPTVLLNIENEDILEELRLKFKDIKSDYIEAEVGCVVGTHSGTGACGIFFVENY
ncbi:DegV family protein [Haloimpatiens sp. FM7315]|uniref:DegV family protein n=1 Tax=Haloimpatiens sp. FM7315 TaxID=3298609 RepID=UPI00370A4513